MILQKDIKKIINKALLDYQINPAFISFKLLSTQACTAAVKKLKLEGYNAIRNENYVVIYI